MSKKTKILIALLIILLIVVIVLFFINKKSVSVNQPQTQQTSSPATSNQFTMPSPSDQKMTINTSQGNIATNNLYKNPVENLSDNGVAFKETSDYYMAFYPQDQGILIAIQGSDMQTDIAEAESALLQTLGITQTQACQLKVSIVIPVAAINAQYPTDLYGLSFCPNPTYNN